MVRGTVNVRLRPIKLAFLVHPNDKESLLKAIEINTFLWGGTFNPIIPTYRRIPKDWEYGPFENPDAQSVLSGYLDNFDPDYVVPMGACSDYPFDVGHREKIDASEILASVDEDGTPTCGIGLFEVLNYFIEQEFKFQRRHPLAICVPSFGPRLRPFLASVFGKFPENIDEIFWNNLAPPLDANKIDCSGANYAQLLSPRNLFLRRMTQFHLEISRVGWRRWQDCIFFLDATKPLDVMDYWNLRAIGWNVIPIPQQFADSDKTKSLARNFVEVNFRPLRSNPEIYHGTTVLKSRSISEEEHEHFVDSLDISPSDEPDRQPKILFQNWYPRVWSEWARRADHVECCNLEAESVQHDISTGQEEVRFKTLDPKFMNRFGGHGRPRFANEIEMRFYGGEELLAEVIPEGGMELVRAIDRFNIWDLRLSRKGLVYLFRHSDRTVSLSLPQAEAIFTKWLEARGWTADVSPAGRIARQMIRQLEKVGGLSILTRQGIIHLLGKMNTSSEKSRSEKFVRSEINKIANQTAPSWHGVAERILQQLIEAKVLQLGMEIQCPVCTQSSWYSVEAVNYELQCPKCLESLSFPHASKEVKWAYRTLGPFSLPNQAHGAYTVLMTLHFFSALGLLDGATTPLMSFTFEKAGTKMEADLALFFQGSKFGDSKTEVVFAECKTFNSFEKKDADRMAKLGKAFPGAFLVFATLKESLSEKEQRILRPLVNRSRKDWKNNRPFNPILILTGKELFLESFWDSHLKDWNIRGLSELCGVTQQINLGMDSPDEWLNKQYGIEERFRYAASTTWTPITHSPEND